MSNNITYQDFSVSKTIRNTMYGHPSFVIWFTGLSGSGKSTLASALEERLVRQKIHTFLLDGDNIRHGLNKDLNFTPEGRHENLRRIAEVARLFVEAGTVTLASFISPTHIDRQHVKDIIGAESFIEVYVNTSLVECERRDVKGLYKKARKGEISNFTGISAPYEAPVKPDFIAETEKYNVDQIVDQLMTFLKEDKEI